MTARLHRLIKKDLRTALAYYDSAGGKKLGDRFFQAVENTIEDVLRHPQQFHLISDGLRRAALKSFPYHFLFEERGATIRFLVLRHNKRHPSFGLGRN